MKTRGRPPVLKEARAERLEIRLHPAERMAIEVAAREAGLTVSEWVRAIALVGTGDWHLIDQLQRVEKRVRP